MFDGDCVAVLRSYLLCLMAIVWLFVSQRYPGERMLGVLPRVTIEFKSTYTASITKQYDMVSQNNFILLLSVVVFVSFLCVKIHVLVSQWLCG